MARASAVVFDLGNVLVEWSIERLYREVIPDVDKRAWFVENVTTAAWNLALDRGRSFDVAIVEKQAEHPDWAEEIAAFRDRWPEMLGEADPGAVALVAELRDAEVRVFALTNWSAETFPHAEARFEWLEWFEGVVVSGREGVTKPDPAMFELLCSRYGLYPAETLFTDDLQLNVDGASQFGFQAALWTGSDEFRRLLVRRGVL